MPSIYMEKPKACEELSFQKRSRQSWNESLGAGDCAWLHSPAPPPPGPLNWSHPRGRGGPPGQQLFSYSFRALKGAVVPTPASKGSQGAKEGRQPGPDIGCRKARGDHVLHCHWEKGQELQIGMAL